MALVLEGAPDQGCGQLVDVRRIVGEYEVLAAGLAYDPRVVLVAVDVLANGPPHPLEHLGGSGKMHTGKVRAGHYRITDVAAAARDHVDDAGRQTGLLQDLHDEVCRVHRRRSRLPDHRVPHQRRGGGQVAGDAGEVERRHGEHEPFQGAVLQVVPAGHAGLRLLHVDLLHVCRVVSPKVDQLAGRIDLRLMAGFGLAQDGGGVEYVAVLACQELRRLEEDCGPVMPRSGGPGFPGGQGGVDGSLDFLFAALVPTGQDVAVVMGHNRFRQLARADIAAADAGRDFDGLAGQALDPGFQPFPLGAARGVGQNRFVVRFGNVEGTVRHHSISYRL